MLSLLLKKIVLEFNRFLFWVFSHREIDKYSIVLESDGDCCDNTYALFDYMKDNGHLSKYKITWLVDRVEDFKSTYNVQYCYKHYNRKLCLDTIKTLARCKYYIFDHCNMMENFNKRNGQVVINLWHGCGIKAAPYATTESNIDLLISTSDFFKHELSKVFGVPEIKIKSLGYPRTDYFYKPLSDKQKAIKSAFEEYAKVILWMPTFRRSKIKDIDETYFTSQTGLPIFESEEDLQNFDHFLSEHKSLCVFKVHHLQMELPALHNEYKNIRIITDEQIRNEGIQLYQYIMLMDALITDYSSISTDYMLLEKPIIYTIDDYDNYKKSRGFAFDNVLDYLAGYKANDKNTFYFSLLEVISGKDEYQKERNKVKTLLNKNDDGNSSYRILSEIGVENAH